MKKITSILLICLTTHFVQAQEPYRNETGKYGFKDAKGNIIIQPKYDKAEAFSNGLAAVNIGRKCNEDGETIEDGKWGYIDSTGKEVIALKYDVAKNYDRFGFAIVINSYKDTTLHLKYGVIDRTGKEVAPLKYDYIDDWGIVERYTAQGVKKGYLDPGSAREIIPLKYDDIHLYQCGIAAVVLNGKYGFVDQLTGKELVPPKYDNDYANSFSEGLAKVSLNENYFYIDKYGNEFAAGDYVGAYSIHGYTIVTLKSQLVYVDSTGIKYSMNKNAGRCYDIFENAAWVDFKEGGMGIVDIKTGKEIYKCINCDVGSGYFSSNGLMELAYPEPMYIDKNGREYYREVTNPLITYKSNNGKYGFCKHTLSKQYADLFERERLPAKYDTIYQVLIYGDWGERWNDVSTEGFRYVGIAGRQGLVDSTGKEITPVKYDWIDYSFWGGEYAKVDLNGKKGLVDKSGREVIAPAYYETGVFSEGLAWVRLTQGGHFGCIDTNGKLVIDTTLNYILIHNFSDGLAMVENKFVNPGNGEEYTLYGYIDKTGKEIIPLKYTSAEDFRNGKAKVQLSATDEKFEVHTTELYIDKKGNEVK